MPDPHRPPGYAHRLRINDDLLCEQGEGDRLRCRRLGTYATEDYGWATYAEGVSSVSLNEGTVCGLQEGRPACWQEDTGTEPQSGPRTVDCRESSFYGLTGLRELAVSEDADCVVSESGRLQCWGLSPGSDARADIEMEGARGVSLGDSLGCAVTTSGVRCWGEAVMEELALPPGEVYAVPVPSPVRVVVSAATMCASSSDGRVYCWGFDMGGSLGRGLVAADEFLGPGEVPGLRAVDLVAAHDTVCALGEDRKSYCWGNNTKGQLGLGHTRRVDTPTHVPGLDGAVDVAPGPEILCARFLDGTLQCVGDQWPLMMEASRPDSGPQRLPGVPMTQLFLSEQVACGRTNDGVQCFGGSQWIGRGHQEAASGWRLDLPTPTEIADLSFADGTPCVRWQDGRLRCDDLKGRVERSGIHAFSAFRGLACLVDATRHVHCWARGLPNPPTLVSGLTDAAVIAVDGGRVCAVTTRGGMACGPARPHHDTPATRLTASRTDIRALALSGERTCALRQGGELDCWEGLTPYRGEIGELSALAYGREAMCVVQAGRVRCLRFEDGAMSLGDALPGVVDVVELASGGEYLCARSTNGEVHCWGSNHYSQQGVLMPSLRLDFVTVSEVEVPTTRLASYHCTETQEDYEEYEVYEGRDDEYDGTHDEDY